MSRRATANAKATTSRFKKKEEKKRDAAFHPVQRWLAIQETIAWAEANLPTQLKRNRPRDH